MLHPERLPLGGSVTYGVASVLATGPRRDRVHPGYALLVIVLISAVLWAGLVALIRWLTGH